MPVFEGVEMLQYVENGPSPNYRPWYEQLALAVEQIYRGHSRTKGLHTLCRYLPTAEEEAADV